ncbi:hypothetical protein [Neptunomonas qingdaonensis]|uniref:Lipoprotein n=1 Tax=Neptunomonas qingdaonensis TaxID=1045558 RepID=A0A1I2N8W9_9GAMM|nr:hypothetical protein [Neptunomonas qingdaonensis]SFG00365.1 hypothetical protein SAMN05216175_102375 [Neptunomonas qingdaonensis]
MQFIKRSSLLITLALLAACSSDKIVQAPPAPAPVYVPPPLIALELAEPKSEKHRGRAGAYIHFSNISSGTYQYVLFRTTAFDKNGKVIRAKKSRDENAYLRVAGPIYPGEYSKGHSWKNTWSKKGVKCIDIDQIEIVFSDGSVEVAQGDTLTKHTTGSCVR